MSKVLIGVMFFFCLSMAVLVLAFDVHFYDKFYYESFNPSNYYNSLYMDGSGISQEAWARMMRDRSQENWPNMWRGLKATMAFSAGAILFSFVGIIAGLIDNKGCKKFTSFLVIITLIGFVVATAVWVGADKSDTGDERFHRLQKDVAELHGNDLPDHMKIWRNAYYGSIVCMVVSVLFGLVGTVLLLRK
jgi:hypothetical protein